MPEQKDYVNSILNSVKKNLGIVEYDFFDADLIVHINSVFADLNQIGVGPYLGFMITDESQLWSDYTDNNMLLQNVKSYMFLRVKLLFDPPANAALRDSITKQIDEFTYRLYVYTDNKNTKEGGDIETIKRILLEHSVKIRQLEKYLEENHLAERLGTAEESIVSLQNDIVSINSTLQDHESRIYTLETEGSAEVKSRLDALEDETERLESSKQDTLTFDNAPTPNSNNPVKSGGVFSSVNNVIEIAEGKTKTFAVSYETLGNENFNSQNDSIELQSFTDVNGESVDPDDVKIGDVVFVTELDVPDRWVGSIVNNTITLYRMETQKVDLTDYYTKAQSDARFFRVIDPPASTTLTAEEVEIFKQGCAVRGTFLGMTNPVFMPASNRHGVVFASSGLTDHIMYSYEIGGTGVIRLGSSSVLLSQSVMALSGYIKIRNKYFPDYPTNNANPANLQIAPNGGNLSWKEVINNLAPEYDATATYAVGDVVMHDGALYQCTTAIATAEAWDATHWAQVKVDDVYANAAKIAAGNVPQDGVLGIDANNNIVKGSLFGKYVRIIEPPTSDTLTEEEYEIIKEGVFMRGIYLNYKNPLFTPGYEEIAGGAYALVGLVLSVHESAGQREAIIGHYSISQSTRKITITKMLIFSGRYGSLQLVASPTIIDSNFRLYGKAVPAYPTSAQQAGKNFHYALNNGSLAWQEQLYGPSVTDNSITELTYEKISVINVAADRTFTLKTAQTDCIPEYRATITNIGSSNVILTFTGITAMKTNDPGITVTGNSLVLPQSTTIEVSAYNGHLIAFNWSV